MFQVIRNLRRFSKKAVDLSAMLDITPTTEADGLPEGTVAAFPETGHSTMEMLNKLRSDLEKVDVQLASLNKEAATQKGTIENLKEESTTQKGTIKSLEGKVEEVEKQLSGLISDKLFIKLFESWKNVEKKLILKHFHQFSVLDLKRGLSLADIRAEVSSAPEASAFLKDSLVIQAYAIRKSAHFHRLRACRNALAHDSIDTVEDFEKIMSDHEKVQSHLDPERAAITQDLKKIPIKKYLRALKGIPIPKIGD